MPQRFPLTDDEIEVACDLLWLVKREAGLSGVAEALWERPQPIRHLDHGGSASTELSLDGVTARVFSTGRPARLDDYSSIRWSR